MRTRGLTPDESTVRLHCRSPRRLSSPCIVPRLHDGPRHCTRASLTNRRINVQPCSGFWCADAKARPAGGGPRPAHKTGWPSCRRGGIDAHSAPNPHPESQDCFPLAASTATRRHLGILLCDRTAKTLNHDPCPRRKHKLGPSLLIAGSELPVEELSSNLNASPVVRSVFWRGITPEKPGVHERSMNEARRGNGDKFAIPCFVLEEAAERPVFCFAPILVLLSSDFRGSELLSCAIRPARSSRAGKEHPGRADG